MLYFFLIVCTVVGYCTCELSLLGIASNKGGGIGFGKGASFTIENSADERLTKLQGVGLALEMESLEIVAGGGSLQFTPWKMQYSQGENNRWSTSYSDKKLHYSYNDVDILQMILPPNSDEQFVLRVEGNGEYLGDVYLSQAGNVMTLRTMCIVDGLLEAHSKNYNGRPYVISSQSEELCQTNAVKSHLSLQNTMEYFSKLMLKACKSVDTALSNAHHAQLTMTRTGEELKIQISRDIADKIRDASTTVQDIATKTSLMVSQHKQETEELLASVRTSTMASLSEQSSIMETVFTAMNSSLIETTQQLQHTFTTRLDNLTTTSIYPIYADLLQLHALLNITVDQLVPKVAEECDLMVQMILDDVIALEATVAANFSSLQANYTLALEQVNMTLHSAVAEVQLLVTVNLTDYITTSLQTQSQQLINSSEQLQSRLNELTHQHSEAMTLLTSAVLINNTEIRAQAEHAIAQLSNSWQLSSETHDRQLVELNESIATELFELQQEQLVWKEVSLGLFQTLTEDITQLTNDTATAQSGLQLQLTLLAEEVTEGRDQMHSNWSVTLAAHQAQVGISLTELQHNLTEERRDRISVSDAFNTSFSLELLQLREDTEITLANATSVLQLNLSRLQDSTVLEQARLETALREQGAQQVAHTADQLHELQSYWDNEWSALVLELTDVEVNATTALASESAWLRAELLTVAVNISVSEQASLQAAIGLVTVANETFTKELLNSQRAAAEETRAMNKSILNQLQQMSLDHQHVLTERLNMSDSAHGEQLQHLHTAASFNHSQHSERLDNLTSILQSETLHRSEDTVALGRQFQLAVTDMDAAQVAIYTDLYAWVTEELGIVEGAITADISNQTLVLSQLLQQVHESALFMAGNVSALTVLGLNKASEALAHADERLSTAVTQLNTSSQGQHNATMRALASLNDSLFSQLNELQNGTTTQNSQLLSWLTGNATALSKAVLAVNDTRVAGEEVQQREWRSQWAALQTQLLADKQLLQTDSQLVWQHFNDSLALASNHWQQQLVNISEQSQAQHNASQLQLVTLSTQHAQALCDLNHTLRAVLQQSEVVGMSALGLVNSSLRHDFTTQLSQHEMLINSSTEALQLQLAYTQLGLNSTLQLLGIATSAAQNKTDTELARLQGELLVNDYAVYAAQLDCNDKVLLLHEQLSDFKDAVALDLVVLHTHTAQLEHSWLTIQATVGQLVASTQHNISAQTDLLLGEVSRLREANQAALLATTGDIHFLQQQQQQLLLNLTTLQLTHSLSVEPELRALTNTTFQLNQMVSGLSKSTDIHTSQLARQQAVVDHLQQSHSQHDQHWAVFGVLGGAEGVIKWLHNTTTTLHSVLSVQQVVQQALTSQTEQHSQQYQQQQHNDLQRYSDMQTSLSTSLTDSLHLTLNTTVQPQLLHLTEGLRDTQAVLQALPGKVIVLEQQVTVLQQQQTTQTTQLLLLAERASKTETLLTLAQETVLGLRSEVTDLTAAGARETLARAQLQEQQQSGDKKQREMQATLDLQVKQLMLAETNIAMQTRRIEQLEEENKRILQNMASQSSVDNLHKLLHDMQSSMFGHSTKVLDTLMTMTTTNNINSNNSHNRADAAATSG